MATFAAMDQKHKAANFEMRCQELGLEGLLPEMRRRGWDTFDGLGYSTAWNTEKPDERFMEEVVNVLIPVDQQPDPRIPNLRKLHMEAWTEVCVDLKRRAEGPSEEVSRKMPAPEREARRQSLMATRPGQTLKRHEEPGYGLVDLAVHMYDTKTIQHVPPSYCPSRAQELKETLPGKSWKPATDADVDISDNMKLDQAYRRRGFAFEEGGLMTALVHDELVDELMKAYTEAPPDPRYATASYEQILAADKYVFEELQHKCRTGFRAVGGRVPLETALREILAGPSFRCMLMPLPKVAGGNPKKRQAENDEGEGSGKSRSARKNAARRKMKEENERLKKQSAMNGGGQASAADSAPRAQPKGGGRTGVGPKMPLRLIGTPSKTPQGEPLCFGFGLGECTAAKPGQKCPKGWHLCAKCSKPDHATVDH